ncbi:unnamed protein product, partial [Polarella glacialis]
LRTSAVQLAVAAAWVALHSHSVQSWQNSQVVVQRSGSQAFLGPLTARPLQLPDDSADSGLGAPFEFTGATLALSLLAPLPSEAASVAEQSSGAPLFGIGSSLDPGSFGLGVLLGFLGALVSLAALASSWLGALRADSRGSDGSSSGGMASKGGLIMPSFLFREAAQVFRQVQKDADAAAWRFRLTGDFEDIYAGIERSEKEVLLQALETLYVRFPKSATRELIFNSLRSGALSSDQFAPALYDLAVRLQPAYTTGEDILTELWDLDENRWTVSGRKPGPGRQPWFHPVFDILLDEQHAASRLTDVDMARRPLFARVAPKILAEPTCLALVRLFDIFEPSGDGAHARESYSKSELAAIDRFLEAVVRTPVMVRAREYCEALASPEAPQGKTSWKDLIFKIWFLRGSEGPCAFEHVFVGNLAEDIRGQSIAGGLHCWLKFYLEEVRGTANYLGHFYTRNSGDAILDSRFVSGKFSWTHGGQRLLKEQGGFFVGVSPEWQLAVGTVSYLETQTEELAASCGWRPWLEARTSGYVKDVAHEGYQYRRVVCRREDATLATEFAIFLGTARASGVGDDGRPGWGEVLESDELHRRLPGILVEEGIALQEDSSLAQECTQFCASSGCTTIREAMSRARAIFDFELELAAAGHEAEVREVVADSAEVAEVLLRVAANNTTNSNNSSNSNSNNNSSNSNSNNSNNNSNSNNSSNNNNNSTNNDNNNNNNLAMHSAGFGSDALPEIIESLKSQGRRGPRIYQPLRLLLTGQTSGAPLGVILRLLELAETQGGVEAGLPLSDRLLVVEK